MLSADVLVLKTPRFLTGIAEHAAQSVGELESIHEAFRAKFAEQAMMHGDQPQVA